MAALQEPRPGQGWSETRPTRAPRRALERTRDEDSAPEPVVSSDSDVEDPSPRDEDEDEPRAPSPPRWLPEVPPTPRYEGEWLTDGARDGDDGAPLATPPWRLARPPTPRYTEPRRPEEQTQSEESTAQPMPQPQEEDIHQARAEEPSVVRTEVPAAHVSHSTRAFEAEGMRWRQQTVTWTWPEGPATGPTKEVPRIWEEGAPKLNPRDPRTRSRQDAWVPPTPSTGPPTSATTAATGEAESLEKGPWVWPVPPATQRPTLQRQVSDPGSTRPRPQFMRQVSAPEEGGWREVARSEWPVGIEEAPAVATARRKGGRRYAAEDPSPRDEDEDEPRAPSPPRWLPEVPPTPRYEGEWLTDGARDGDDGAPLATPPWRLARPPTPRYTEPRRPEEQTQSEESTAQPMPQPQEEDIHQARAEEPSVVRTEVPAAHVSHSTRAFEAEGMRWRQQTVTWTWPEGPATGPTKEVPRIWEEGAPKLNPRDPRTRSRQDAWVPPTPSTGPPTSATTAATGEAESLEKGPWVWPVPPAIQRPTLQRQVSDPGSTRPRPQFMRQVSAPEEGGWREVARSEWPVGIEEAPAVATARRKGGRRCVLVCEGGRRYRVRLGVAGIRVFAQ
ncbi:proteoglycan 4-like [Drosophila subpulchrella]|uniref:proteoglycan 4-like n=1 Tax=Drosophila subpulchrella TaxID=1486046 RepID=UPI0018A1A57C|nr:proteoglycan 4-like [Drosophila subpulchrella]